jgi:hypothetical protein
VEILPLNALQKRRLLEYCKKHGIDFMEIDSSLSYAEALSHLKALTPSTIDEISETWAKSLEDYEENVSLSDLYGVPYEAHDAAKPVITLKVYVKINRNTLTVARNRLKKHAKNVKFMFRQYVAIQGQPNEVFNILSKIEDLRPRVLRKTVKHNSAYAYLPGFGWTALPH